ncbi:hypothetical protein DXG01_006205, partial [Tephrocybe rancida]
MAGLAVPAHRHPEIAALLVLYENPWIKDILSDFPTFNGALLRDIPLDPFKQSYWRQLAEAMLRKRISNHLWERHWRRLESFICGPALLPQMRACGNSTPSEFLCWLFLNHIGPEILSGLMVGRWAMLKENTTMTS